MDWKIMGYSQGKERVNMPVTCKEDKRQLTALVTESWTTTAPSR